MLVVRLRAP